MPGGGEGGDGNGSICFITLEDKEIDQCFEQIKREGGGSMMREEEEEEAWCLPSLHHMVPFLCVMAGEVKECEGGGGRERGKGI